MKKVSTNNKSKFGFKKNSFLLGLFSVGIVFNPLLKAEQIANSSIDLKKDIDNIKQNDFKNKDNLDSQIKQTIDEGKKTQRKIREKTILLKEILFSGNKQYSDESLLKFFEGLIGKDVTFRDLSNASLKIQSFYRDKGFITTRAIIPKQDFLNGIIKIAIIESYLEDIVITGGTEGTRDYIKYMTGKILMENKENKIFNFSDLERQLLLIKRSDIGKLTSTLSKGSNIGSSILTINIEPNPLNISAFSNTDISSNLGDYTVGLKSSYTTKSSKPIKIGTSAKYAFPIPDGLTSGVLVVEKPIARKGLSLNSIVAYSTTKTKDLFPLTAGESINKGTSEYFSLGMSYPFVLKRNTEIGFDLSTTIQNSHQDLYQNNVKSNNVSTDRIRAIRVGINGRKSLKRSYNTARFLFTQAFKGWDDELTSAQQKSNLDSILIFQPISWILVVNNI